MRYTVYGYTKPNTKELYLYKDGDKPLLAEVVAFEISQDRALVYIHTTDEYIVLHTDDFLLPELYKPSKNDLILYGYKKTTSEKLLDKWIELQQIGLRFKTLPDDSEGLL